MRPLHARKEPAISDFPDINLRVAVDVLCCFHDEVIPRLRIAVAE